VWGGEQPEGRVAQRRSPTREGLRGGERAKKEEPSRAPPVEEEWCRDWQVRRGGGRARDWKEVEVVVEVKVFVGRKLWDLAGGPGRAAIAKAWSRGVRLPLGRALPELLVPPPPSTTVVFVPPSPPSGPLKASTSSVKVSLLMDCVVWL
jgi:hypothetical protein